MVKIYEINDSGLYLNEDVENPLVGRLLLAENLHVERRDA